MKSVSWQFTKPGLSRISYILNQIGNPERDMKFIHVAGTNGKGSVCAMCYSILRNNGYRTGLFASPFLERFTERIQVDGKEITEADFARIVTFLEPTISKMEDTPTEFEIETAAAFLYFKEMKCDIVVLEVGMGGLLDSTNIIPSCEVAAFTSVSLDHTEFLGKTVEEIAKTKAGIIKRNCDVVCACGEDSCTIIENEAMLLGAGFFRTKPEQISNTRLDKTGIYFDFSSEVIGSLGQLYVPLRGLFQIKNALVVLSICERLQARGWSIKMEAIRIGLAKTCWKGRFELLHSEVDFIFDGAHNPEGAEGFASTYRHIYGEKKAVFIIGMMADKDIEGILSRILPLAECVIAVRPDNSRALDAEELVRAVEEKGISACAALSPYDAVKASLEKADNKKIICCVGSLYLYRDIKKGLADIIGCDQI